MVNLNNIELEFKAHHFLYVVVAVFISISLIVLFQQLQDAPATDIKIIDFTGFDDFWGGLESELTIQFEAFTENEIFKRLGVVITFLYSMSPSVIPIPNELFMTPIILAEPTPDEQFNQAVFLIILTSVGGFIGDSLMFFGAKKHIHKIFRSDKKEELAEDHMFHKYGIVIFLGTPSLWFAGGLAEVALVFAGYAQTSFAKLAPFLLGGNIIRGIWGGLVFLSVLGLL